MTWSFKYLVVLLVVLPYIDAMVLNNVVFNYTQPSEVLRTASSRIRGVRDRIGKDFVLGGLIPIHSAADGGGACGEVRLERGLERMEAMLFAIDKINGDETLLPGLTLGYDIRDTCSSENIGLDETVDLILTSSQIDVASCQSSMAASSNETLTPPTTGIVGAAASRVSIPVASLVRLFTTPQISYASSSALLSNRDRYEYFYRTIPPDNLQARAMVDVMLHFKWSYVSTIYSLNPYGEPGINEFQMLAATKGICIDLDVGISDDFSEDQFRGLARDLINSEANVVILFTSQDNAESLLRFIAESEASRRFIWIASDAWARSISVVQQFNTTSAGLYGFSPLTEHLDKFQDYFSRLTLDSNVRNPWFEEFYMAVANCTTDDTLQLGQPCNRSSNITRLPSYQQGNFIPLVVDAVYTYAYALQNFLDDHCAQPLQWFPENRTCFNQTRELNGSSLLEYIYKANFKSVTGNKVLFDSEGNVEGQYEIVNYQAAPSRDGRMEYSFERVGVWDSSVLNDSDLQALLLDSSKEFQFGVDEATNEVRLSPPVSQCGRCRQGYYRRIVQSSCCGFCEPCLGQNFSRDPMASSCLLCEEESWGNNPLVGSNSCVPVEESFLSGDHPYSIIIIIITILGLACVAFTTVVYAVYWTTPVIKSSGREQMILLLIGITCSFFSAFFFVSPPVVAICGIQRWLLWTSFSIMFGALLIKITRVARIFLRKTSLVRPRFTEPQYQVLFTMILVFIQMIILAISFGVQPPEVQRSIRLVTDEPNETPTVVVTCAADDIVLLILSVGYESVLIIICTILGVLSFSYPDNFNEAKFVAFCSLAILVIWVAFIITFFATQAMQEFQNIAISLAVVMTGFAVLFSLFARRVFIVLFQPDRNVIKYSQHSVKDGNNVSMGLITDQVPSQVSSPDRKNYSMLGCLIMSICLRLFEWE